MEGKRLLVVANVPSANTRTLADAVCRGARHEDIAGVAVRHVPPLEAGPEDVAGADAIVLGTTENFGYMSGALKDFFDRIYYPCLERTEAMPYALYVKGGKDGTGARRAVESIAAGLRWREVRPALVLSGPYKPEFAGQCEELGTYVAAGLEAGLF